MNQGTALLAFALTLLPGAGLAAPLYSGSVAGTFSAPVYAGMVFNPNGTTTAVDNTGTAVVGGVGTGQIAWGDCDATCGAVPFHSVVTFTGGSFVDVAPDVLFKLGTLSFLNGTSLNPTVIFGATLTIEVLGSPIVVEITQMSVHVTGNGGIDPFADADTLLFDQLPGGFHVFEGKTAVADVYGYIDDSQQLVLASLVLPPDQAGNGFLPEPGILGLLGFGLALLGLTRRIKGRAGSAARLRVRPDRWTRGRPDRH